MTILNNAGKKNNISLIDLRHVVSAPLLNNCWKYVAIEGVDVELT